MKIMGRSIWTALALTISLVLVFSCAKEKEPYKVGAVFSLAVPRSWVNPKKRLSI